MTKETGGAGRAHDPEVRIGPAGDQTDEQRLEALRAESTYAVERLKEKVAKAEQQFKDARAALAEAQDNAKAVGRTRTMRREEV